MTPHSSMQVGAIKTRVLILLIALIVCGVAGTVILSHFMKADRKPDAVPATQAAMPRADRQIAQQGSDTPLLELGLS